MDVKVAIGLTIIGPLAKWFEHRYFYLMFAVATDLILSIFCNHKHHQEECILIRTIL